MKNKGFIIVLIIYVITLFADTVSTLINWKLLEHLESNPLFKYGGIPLVIFINFLLIGILYWVYNKTNNTTLRFIFMFILISVITTRVIVIFNNINVFLNPPSIQQLEAIGEVALQQMKVQQVKQLIYLNILPFLNGVLCWLFFESDHEVKIKNECRRNIKRKGNQRKLASAK